MCCASTSSRGQAAGSHINCHNALPSTCKSSVPPHLPHAHYQNCHPRPPVAKLMVPSRGSRHHRYSLPKSPPTPPSSPATQNIDWHKTLIGGVTHCSPSRPTSCELYARSVWLCTSHNLVVCGLWFVQVRQTYSSSGVWAGTQQLGQRSYKKPKHQHWLACSITRQTGRS